LVLVALFAATSLPGVAHGSRVPIAIQSEDEFYTPSSTSFSPSGATAVEGASVASVQAVVTEAGVSAVQHALTPQLVNHLLGSLQIPPITGKDSISVLGLTVDILYSVANISVTNVTFDQDKLAIVPGSGVSFSVADGAAKITADFGFDIPNPLVNLKGTGVADIKVSQLAVQLQVSATADQKGYPVISCPKASVVLGKFNTNITFNSSILDAILEFFLYLFNGLIKSQIQSAITDAIYTNLNVTVNELIHNQTLLIGLPPNGSQAVLDVSLPSPPIFAPGYLLIPITGEVFLASGLHSNYTPVPLPALATGQMLQLTVGQYLFNTAGWAYYKSGLLTYLITNSVLPAWLPFKLNTATFSFILPNLYKLYPNWDMAIDFLVSKPISFNIDTSSKTQGMAVNMVGDMQVNVIAPNGSWINVFDLETTFKLKFELYFSNDSSSVHGKFYIASFTTVIKSSQIGTFDVSVINFFLDALFDNVLLYPVNEYLMLYPLFTFPPLAGFHYVNPALVYSKDFVTLSADFAVTPELARSLGL
jgi:hypothetical protein